jgi:hypothetical protein
VQVSGAELSVKDIILKGNEYYGYDRGQYPIALRYYDQAIDSGVYISDMRGDVSGVISGGTGNIAGKYVVVGSGTINVSERELTQIQNNVYAQCLRDFSENINKQLKDRQIPDDQIKSINQSMSELAKEVEDIKPGKEQEIDYVKQINIEGKTASVIQKVYNVLPQTAETAAAFTPLAPFSKLIGKSVQEIVNAIQKRKSSSTS